MRYTMTSPCEDCPFLKEYADFFTLTRLKNFAAGAFPCHKTAKLDHDESGYCAQENSVHCAGALVFLEKRNRSNQMMRIAERLGFYDRTKLDMTAAVR